MARVDFHGTGIILRYELQNNFSVQYLGAILVVALGSQGN
jgi:hypothetical protein